MAALLSLSLITVVIFICAECNIQAELGLQDDCNQTCDVSPPCQTGDLLYSVPYRPAGLDSDSDFESIKLCIWLNSNTVTDSRNVSVSVSHDEGGQLRHKAVLCPYGDSQTSLLVEVGWREFDRITRPRPRPAIIARPAMIVLVETNDRTTYYGIVIPGSADKQQRGRMFAFGYVLEVVHSGLGSSTSGDQLSSMAHLTAFVTSPIAGNELPVEVSNTYDVQSEVPVKMSWCLSVWCQVTQRPLSVDGISTQEDKSVYLIFKFPKEAKLDLPSPLHLRINVSEIPAISKDAISEQPVAANMSEAVNCSRAMKAVTNPAIPTSLCIVFLFIVTAPLLGLIFHCRGEWTDRRVLLTAPSSILRRHLCYLRCLQFRLGWRRLCRVTLCRLSGLRGASTAQSRVIVLLDGGQEEPLMELEQLTALEKGRFVVLSPWSRLLLSSELSMFLAEFDA